MPTVTGPCFSLEAKGSIGKAITFQKKGKGQAAMKRPVPTGGPSAAQSEIRGWMADAVAAWKALTPAEREDWEDYVS